MNRPLLALAVSVSFAWIVSCGGSVTVGTGGSSGTGAGNTGSGAGTTGTGTGPTGCPASQPSGSCAGVTDGLSCTYGDAVDPACRTQVLCAGGQWMPQHGAGTCTSPPPGACPATEPQNQITTCTAMGTVCSYANTLCVCDACAGGLCMAPPIKWQCTNPQGPPACPPVVPNEGTACSMDGLSCTYGFPCGGAGTNVQCTSGAWAWTLGACPG